MNRCILPDFTSKATQWNKTSNIETPLTKNKPCLFKPGKTQDFAILVVLTEL